MQTHISCQTYSGGGGNDIFEGLKYFIGFDRLLVSDNVLQLDIDLLFSARKSVSHLQTSQEHFQANLPNKPILEYFKTTKKLSIRLASKVDAANYDIYSCKTPNILERLLPFMKKSIDKHKQSIASDQAMPRHQEFVILFHELNELFNEYRSEIKQKWSLDCQPILEEMSRQENNLPTNPEELAKIISDAKGARAATPQIDIEMPIYHAAPLPKLFPVNRYEGGSNYIGKTKDGEQFWAQVAAQVAKQNETSEDDWQKRKTWYAILHKFNKDGAHLNTIAERIGTTSEGEAAILQRAKTRMEELITELGQIKYERIKIQLFQTVIDGFTFGLVDTSTEEWGDTVTMQPGDLVFYPPWNGDYDT